ncbi:Hypothetical predicted protein, partial [Mytilus galloprovincialis]
MPRSHIHGSPCRIHYRLNFTGVHGNAVSVVRYRYDTEDQRIMKERFTSSYVKTRFNMVMTRLVRNNKCRPCVLRINS